MALRYVKLSYGLLHTFHFIITQSIIQGYRAVWQASFKKLKPNQKLKAVVFPYEQNKLVLFYNLLLQSCRANVITGSIPCFSVYISAQNTRKARELMVHNKSITKLNTSICLYFMYVTRKLLTANLKLIDNLIVSPDTSTVPKASCADWLACSQEISELKKQLIVCLISVTKWLASNVDTRILIRTHKFRTPNKTRSPLNIFVSRNRWHPLAECWGSAETGLR
jgi:hypothetical protein